MIPSLNNDEYIYIYLFKPSFNPKYVQQVFVKYLSMFIRGDHEAHYILQTIGSSTIKIE